MEGERSESDREFGLDGKLASVEAALGTNAVVQYGCTAVVAVDDVGNRCLFMRPALVPTCFGYFALRMCHCYGFGFPVISMI